MTNLFEKCRKEFYKGNYKQKPIEIGPENFKIKFLNCERWSLISLKPFAICCNTIEINLQRKPIEKKTAYKSDLQ